MALAYSGNASSDDDDASSDTSGDADDADSDSSTETDTVTDTVGEWCDGWYDPTTGLCWEEPMVFEYPHGLVSFRRCTAMGGSWRLPTISEMRTLIRPGNAAGDCANNVPEGSCLAHDPDCLDYTSCKVGCGECEQSGGPNDGCYWPEELSGPCIYHWSGSPTTTEGAAWLVDYSTGELIAFQKSSNYDARCVKDTP